MQYVRTESLVYVLCESCCLETGALQIVFAVRRHLS